MTGNCLQTLKGHNKSVMSASFSPDGTTLATASCDKTAKIWDVITGNCLQILKGHAHDEVYSASFSPDGTTLVTASGDGTAKIWDVTTLERFFTREITLPQAVLLNAVYEIVIIRALVKKWGQKAFHQEASVNSQIDHLSGKALSLLGEENSHLCVAGSVEAILFDFDKYPHLREPYRSLPAMIKNILELYVSRIEGNNDGTK